MATRGPKALTGGFSFRLQLDGIDRGGFREASGLDSAHDPVDYRASSNEPLPAQKLPRPNATSSIVLKSGMIVDDPELSAWQAGLTAGKAITNKLRKNLSIVLLDPTGRREIRRWNLRGAYPVNWTGQGLKATGKEVVVDTLELAHEGVELV